MTESDIDPTEAGRTLQKLSAESRQRNGNSGRPITRTCTCGAPNGRHKTTCPVYHREYERERRARAVKRGDL